VVEKVSSSHGCGVLIFVGFPTATATPALKNLDSDSCDFGPKIRLRLHDITCDILMCNQNLNSNKMCTIVYKQNFNGNLN